MKIATIKNAKEVRRSEMALSHRHAGTLEAVQEAAELIRPHIRRTPALGSDLDSRLVLKAECLQVTGSFKARGAFNAILNLARQGAAPRGVITASSGNHAQAVALAARTAGLRAVILIPEGANPQKVNATKALGAEVISEGITFQNRDEKLKEYTDELGLTLVHPYDDWDVIHGQGTGALELLQDHPDASTLVVPVGGGGQISGWAIAAKGLASKVRVVGVEPSRGDDAMRSLESKERVRLTHPPDTIADGVKTLSIGQRNYEIIVERGLVDEIVTVDEDEIEEAVRVAWLKSKLAVEPTGALSLAAFIAGKVSAADGDEGKIGVCISGGNFDPALMAGILTEKSR